MKTSLALLIASAVMLALCAMPASAQPYNRTWVSATGADDGTCGATTSPCASFQGALANTAAGGEIDCLTPGDFGGASGAVMITQSVSIVCDRVSNGGIVHTGSSGSASAVFVNAPSGAVVNLSGLDLDGVGSGLQGVNVYSGSTVYIAHSTIRGFTEYGVFLGAITTARVVIKDSIIVNNTTGVSVASGGASNAIITVNTVIDGNADYGAVANASVGPSSIALIQSLLTGTSTSLTLLGGGSGVLIGPSNTIAGAITGTTTSAPFK